jgi:hypothetical protein
LKFFATFALPVKLGQVRIFAKKKLGQTPIECQFSDLYIYHCFCFLICMAVRLKNIGGLYMKKSLQPSLVFFFPVFFIFNSLFLFGQPIEGLEPNDQVKNTYQKVYRTNPYYSNLTPNFYPDAPVYDWFGLDSQCNPIQPALNPPLWQVWNKTTNQWVNTNESPPIVTGKGEQNNKFYIGIGYNVVVKLDKYRNTQGTCVNAELDFRNVVLIEVCGRLKIGSLVVAPEIEIINILDNFDTQIFINRIAEDEVINTIAVCFVPESYTGTPPYDDAIPKVCLVEDVNVGINDIPFSFTLDGENILFDDFIVNNSAFKVFPYFVNDSGETIFGELFSFSTLGQLKLTEKIVAGLKEATDESGGTEASFGNNFNLILCDETSQFEVGTLTVGQNANLTINGQLIINEIQGSTNNTQGLCIQGTGVIVTPDGGVPIFSGFGGGWITDPVTGLPIAWTPGVDNNICGFPDGELPIELLSFTPDIKADRIELNWTTGTEINNDYFTIERSRDMYGWEVLGFVPGAGNSSVPLSYSFSDLRPLDGLAYYRLKQTDFDGKFEYFGPIAAHYDLGMEGLDFKVLKQYTNWVIAVPNDGVYQVEVYNLMGHRLVSEKIENTITIPAPEGAVVIRVTDGFARSASRVVM